MIVYNETYVIEEAIAPHWLEFMKTEQIPAILKTGWFQSYKILSVLDSPNEGKTYCVQYFTDTVESYSHFMKRHINWFQQLVNQKFENQFVVFNSVMEEVL